MVDADPCLCDNEKFVLAWERLCNECEYDIQIALDEGFTEMVLATDDFTAYYPARLGDGGFFDPASNTSPSLVVWQGALDCNTTYYWRVRTRYAETGETIRSWYSDVWSFTIAAGPGSPLTLLAPDDGASNVPLTAVGFTWTDVDDADGYDYVLSANADLSSPLASESGLSGTAFTYTGNFDYTTTYFWQVTAMKEGQRVRSEQHRHLLHRGRARGSSRVSRVPRDSSSPARPPLPPGSGWLSASGRSW